MKYLFFLILLLPIKMFGQTTESVNYMDPMFTPETSIDTIKNKISIEDDSSYYMQSSFFNNVNTLNDIFQLEPDDSICGFELITFYDCNIISDVSRNNYFTTLMNQYMKKYAKPNSIVMFVNIVLKRNGLVIPVGSHSFTIIN